MSPETRFLMMPAALTCASAVNASEHVEYWSHVPHPPLFQPLDWMDPVPGVLLVALCL